MNRTILFLLVFAALLSSACGGIVENTVVVTATPTPMISDPIPTMTSPPANTPIPTPTFTDVPTETLTVPQSITKAAINRPTYTPMPIPPPTPTLDIPVESVELPLELTQGVRALVNCAGQTESYWLENGPPTMNAKLVDCLSQYLEAN